MKPLFYTAVLFFVLVSCKKEVSERSSDDFLASVKIYLKDSLLKADYSALDFSHAVINKVDSEGLYFLRVPFKGKTLAGDFVIVKANSDGKVVRGRIIHLEGRASEYGEGKIKRRAFEGSVTISSLNRRNLLNSPIARGFITAFHTSVSAREQGTDPVYPVDVLPEVIVVAYVRNEISYDYSTWLWLNSFLDAGTSEGGSDNYYGSLGGDEGGDYGGGGGGYSGGGGDGSGAITDETILVDIESYVDNPAIDVSQYLKCFDKIPDDGATCSITIFTDIPVDSDPSKLFNWNTESPGHCFLQLKKSNGTQSVQQSIGFYPVSNWKNILSADPVDSKVVDNGHHEFNASLKMNLTPFLFRSAIGKAIELSKMKYDMDEFNCTDFALQVFNYVRTPLQIPQYVIPGGVHATNTPQGLYNKLSEMWLNNDPEKNNITIDILKGYVGGSSGPCN